jgi:tetraprenyl-beta-curcumene synthase
VARELCWGLPAVAREVAVWRSRAASIPCPEIREDALSALSSKRGHTDGAALFTILPRAREPQLLSLLVAYELVWDFLDTVNEHGGVAGQVNGKQLHIALVDALAPGLPLSDYFRHHPWQDDDGYLRALVNACRHHCQQLPSYECVRDALRVEATRALVLGINHELDPVRRDLELRKWAAHEVADSPEHSWYELTGAASASLTIHALLTLASERGASDTVVKRVRDAYFPWISAATTMLDSYVDRAEDALHGDHSYVAHYPSPAHAARRIRELIVRCLDEAGALPGGEHHALIVACMVAMYLSKDSARTPAMRATSAGFVRSGGRLTQLLHPILRLWRIAYSQRST